MKIAICDDCLTDAEYLRNICLQSPLLPDSVIDIFTDSIELLYQDFGNRLSYNSRECVRQCNRGA